MSQNREDIFQALIEIGCTDIDVLNNSSSFDVQYCDLQFTDLQNKRRGVVVQFLKHTKTLYIFPNDVSLSSSEFLAGVSQ